MKVLIVEDDLALAGVLSYTLRQAGYEAIAAHDGLIAIEQWQAERPDLIVLDLNLPRLDGLGVCQRIRAESDVPIIMLTVRSDEDDVVRGLQTGADDYIAKPFSPRELVARIETVMRRAGVQAAPGPLEAAGLTLDRARREVRRAGGVLASLTALEVRLLEALMLAPGQVLPADSLITAVWGPGGADRAMLKQLVYRLRRKLGPDPSDPVYVETVPGVGYALVEEAQED